MAAARRLHPDYDVTVYEARRRPGGHSRTITLEFGGRKVPVDTGFIVYNECNYPRLTRLFDELRVASKPASMSFGVSAEAGRVEWSSNSAAGLFADPKHLAHPPFLRMLADIRRFNRTARKDLESGAVGAHTVGSYLEWRRLGKRFCDHYLVPMGAAIWCMPDDDMLSFPALNFLSFFDNHGLLGRNRHRWRTVRGGSAVYVDRMAAALGWRLRLNCPVTQIRRSGTHVIIIDDTGHTERFDEVILACHSDTALSLLGDADEEERRILGALRYLTNDVYLHCDPALMPRRRRAWSSWNVVIPPDRRTDKPEGMRSGVTYWMNRLQGLDGTPPLFVSVNPARPPHAELTFDFQRMDHPRVDWRAIAARRALPAIQGRRRVWFCGAYTGSGFHEDGLLSGERAADRVLTSGAVSLHDYRRRAAG